MRKTKLQRVAAIFAIAALVMTSMISLVGAAPVADAVRSTEITGTVPGGQFAEIWLDLEVIEPGTVTVLATWESGNLDGVGFHILDERGVATVAGTSFGYLGEGYVRFSYANSVNNIRTALSRVEEALAR